MNRLHILEMVISLGFGTYALSVRSNKKDTIEKEHFNSNFLNEGKSFGAMLYMKRALMLE